MQQSAFSRSRRANDRDQFSGFTLTLTPDKTVISAAARAIFLAQIARLNQHVRAGGCVVLCWYRECGLGWHNQLENSLRTSHFGSGLRDPDLGLEKLYYVRCR